MTTLQVMLDEEDVARLADRAARCGKPLEQLVRDLIHDFARTTTWAEGVQAIQDAMAGHGMTEDESLALFESEREAMWAERREAAQQAGGPVPHSGREEP